MNDNKPDYRKARGVFSADDEPAEVVIRRLRNSAAFDDLVDGQELRSHETLTESLAEYAHEAWAGWMNYLFELGTDNDDGSFTIRSDKVARWKRQAATAYADLPEGEKGSARTEARKALEIVFP
jgi:hypothetical protein